MNEIDPEVSPGGSVLRPYAPRKGGPRFGHTESPAEWVELREAHYETWFGTCTYVWHELWPLIPHVDIHIFPPSASHDRDFYTLATSGMSDERMSLDNGVASDLARAELLMYLPLVEVKPYDTNEPWYIRALRYLAHFPFTNETWLGNAHTIQNGTPPEPFAPDSELTTALLLRPVFETKEFQSGLRLGNDPLNFLWVTLLTAEETKFKLENGFNALMDRFQAVNYPRVLDVHRKSILE